MAQGSPWRHPHIAIPPSLVCLLAMGCAVVSPGDAPTANGNYPTALDSRDGGHAPRVDTADVTPSSRIGREPRSSSPIILLIVS